MKTPDDEHLETPAQKDTPSPRKKKKRRAPEEIAAEKRAWLEKHEWGDMKRAVEKLNGAAHACVRAAGFASSKSHELGESINILGQSIFDAADKVKATIPKHVQ